MAIEIGNTVEVLQRGTAARHMVGVRGRVVKVNSDGWVYVEDPTGQGVFAAYGDTTSWMFMPAHVKKVEEDLAEWEQELLGTETKQEETPVKRALKVGDKVRLLTDGGFEDDLVAGDEATVAAVDGGLVNLSNGLTYFYNSKNAADEIEPVATEKPKARSQEITLEDVHVGDTVVAFWDHNGVEYRQKGTVAEINGQGKPITSKGNFVVHAGGGRGGFGEPAEHIYLLDRPETKPEDALDKAKTYVVNYKKADGSKLAAYYLKHVGGAWRYSTTPDVDDSEDTIEGQVRHLIEGETLWEKPVEYVEPPKTIQEQLDELGVKATDVFRNSGLYYQFIGEGRLRFFGNQPSSHARAVGNEDVEAIRSGEAVKI